MMNAIDTLYQVRVPPRTQEDEGRSHIIASGLTLQEAQEIKAERHARLGSWGDCVLEEVSRHA